MELNKLLNQLLKILLISLIIFVLIYLIQKYVPSILMPFSGALILFTILLAQWKRVSTIELRHDLLKDKLEKIDTSIISIENSKEPFRILSKKVDVEWNRGMISSDLANYLVQTIFLNRPRKILECGIGLSTRLIAESISQIGEGKLISLEHDIKWVEIIEASLKKEKLNRFVEFNYVPLKKYQMENESFEWYSKIDKINSEGPYDLILIDGPPSVKPTDPGRVGALFVLMPSIKKGTIILLDDGNRESEKNAVNVWMKHYKGMFKSNIVDLKKGLWIIEKVTD